MGLKNILVPIDFSEASKNALKVAIDIAKKSSSKIFMVNAMHIHTPLPDFRGGGILEEVMQDYESQMKAAFEELESELIELKDIPHQSDRFTTYLTDAIHTEVAKNQIDLVVMGTRSERTLGERLLGSNAVDIIKLIDVPVFVIPEGYSFKGLQAVGFASDFLKVRDYGSLRILKDLSVLYGAEVMVFHIAEKIGEPEQVQINKIKQALSTLENVSIRIVAHDSVVEGIKSFATSHKLNALALMPRKHNLFERLFMQSVTQSIVIDLDIPLLSFHE
jgi:nucleotide-binding universal stress UspA family protein